MNRKLLLATVLMGLCVFFSCSDDDDPASAPDGSAIKLPSKVTFFDEDGPGQHHYINFLYDDKNRITQYVMDDNYGISTHKFTYDSNGNLTKIVETRNSDILDTVFYSFQYKSGEIIETVVYKEGSKINSTYTETHKINNKGQMVTVDSENDGGWVYTFDAAGNITSGKGYESVYGINYLVYDNKKGVLSQVKTPLWICQVLSDLEFFQGYFFNNCSKEENLGEDEIYNLDLKYDNNDYLYQIYFENKLAVQVEYIAR